MQDTEENNYTSQNEKKFRTKQNKEIIKFIIIGISAFLIILILLFVFLNKSKIKQYGNSNSVLSSSSINDNKIRKLAIVIINLGLNKKTLSQALELPNNITLGFSPYSNNLKNVLADAQQKGFSTIMELPTQMKFSNYYGGIYTINESIPLRDNILRIEELVKLSDSCKGFYLAKGDDIQHSLSLMKLILQTLNKARMPLLYHNEYQDTHVERQNSFAIDLSLDSNLQLYNVINVNKTLKKDYSIVVINPYPHSFKHLKILLNQIENNAHMQLVPISQVINN